MVQRWSALADGSWPAGGSPQPSASSRLGRADLQIADRRDQIFFKLYAAVDQGPRSKHIEDLRRLKPTADELRAAAAWARTHDPSVAFRVELRGALRDLGIVDGDI